MISIYKFGGAFTFLFYISNVLSPLAIAVEKFPYEYFSKPTDYSEVKSSPDGQYLAIRYL